MSFPYPQDRNRDRREKGEQPYKEARQAMSVSEAGLQAEAEAFGESHLRTEEERVEDLERLAAESMREVGAEREHIHKGGDDVD